jgi:hypothetical protein
MGMMDKLKLAHGGTSGGLLADLGRLKISYQKTCGSVAFTKCPRQLLFFGQPMWLAQLNAVLMAEPLMLPAPTIWDLAHLRQRFVRWSQARVNCQFRCPQGRRSRGIGARAWGAETLWECGRGRRLRATSPGQLPSTDEGGRRRARLSPAQVRHHAA